MSPADQLRIGDTERDRAATELAEHYAQGRLDADEHGERLDAVWRARTMADLRPLFADLPGPRPAFPEPPVVAVTRSRPRLPWPLVALLAVLLAVTVLAHLPVILVGVAAWLLLTRRGVCGAGRARGHHRPHWS